MQSCHGRGPVREKVRPARSQHPKFGVFALAGRVFSRKCHCRGGVGRTFSCQPVRCPGLGCDAVHFRVAAVGVLRHAKPSSGVSSACRSLGWRHSPRLVAVSSQFAVVSWPNCRPIGGKSPKTALLAEWVCDLAESIAVVVHCSHVNPLLRVLTRYVARRPAIVSVGGTAQARISGLTCGLEGRRARGCWRALAICRVLQAGSQASAPPGI